MQTKNSFLGQIFRIFKKPVIQENIIESDNVIKQNLIF